MMQRRSLGLFIALGLITASGCDQTPAESPVQAEAVTDPLPSWNDGDTKSAIVDFIARVSDSSSSGFVPVDERIATFDNDGTLWSEQPLYFQLIFAVDRVREMATDHPEWSDTEPFKSAIAGDMKGVMAGGMPAIEKIMLEAHTNMTAEEFARSVRDWVATAKHPQTGRPYTKMVFQPMLELLDYLRANDFKTFIVSGGGIDFMRVFSEEVYGIPPEQVVGSQLIAEFEMRDGVPTIVKKPKIFFIDDKVGKPVGIYQHIGRRPVLAGGNADADMQMLEYTTIARDANDTRPRLGLIVHHTDAEREYAYDRDSHMGTLDKGLDDASRRGWIVIDMKEDWSQIYPGSGS